MSRQTRFLVIALWVLGWSSTSKASEWTASYPSHDTTVLEGVSKNGVSRMQITCKRAALEMNFTFADGLRPSHIRWQTDGGIWHLQAGTKPGLGLTVAKPHSYAVLSGMTSGKEVKLQGFVMGSIGGKLATFDMSGLRDLVHRYGDTCFFWPRPPRA